MINIGSDRGKRLRATPIKATRFTKTTLVSVLASLDKESEALAQQRVVLLDCENEPSCGLWVPHVFVRRQYVLGSADERGFEIVYACRVCGKERRYGFDGMGTK